LIGITFFLETEASAEPQLELPDISENAIMGYTSGLRPFRNGGIRLEIETLGDKRIIHNYGHGGSGISLSWGTAAISLQLLDKHLEEVAPSEIKEIAVLGSGVIGLTTAHLLLEKGYKVHIYAKDFPPNTTSNVAPAIWSPFILGDVDLDNKTFWEIYKFSLQKYRSLAFSENPEFKGVRYVNAYSFRPDPPSHSNISEDIYEKKKTIQVLLPNEKLIIGKAYKQLLIDTSIYMEDLYQKVKRQGALFTSCHLKNWEELKTIPEKLVFNCLGLGSREVFQDTALEGIRGQIIYLKPSQEINYALFGRQKMEDPDIYFIPLNEKIALGGSYELNENTDKYDKTVVDEILNSTRKFFKLACD